MTPDQQLADLRRNLARMPAEQLAERDDMIDQQALHIEARQHADLRRWQGYVLDKKQLRWNDIVAVGEFYAACGATPSMEVAIAGVREAVDACGREIRTFDIIGPCQCDPLYIWGSSALTMVQSWMLAEQLAAMKDGRE